MYTTALFILKWYLVHKQTSWTESMHWTPEKMCAFFHFSRIQLSSTHTYLSYKHFITCFAHAFVKADRIHLCFVRNQKLQYKSSYFFQITAGFSQTICALWEIPWTMGCLWLKTVLFSICQRHVILSINWRWKRGWLWWGSEINCNLFRCYLVIWQPTLHHCGLCWD